MFASLRYIQYETYFTLNSLFGTYRRCFLIAGPRQQ